MFDVAANTLRYYCFCFQEESTVYHQHPQVPGMCHSTQHHVYPHMRSCIHVLPRPACPPVHVYTHIRVRDFSACATYHMYMRISPVSCIHVLPHPACPPVHVRVYSMRNVPRVHADICALTVSLAFADSYIVGVIFEMDLSVSYFSYITAQLQ